jgi:hypothetical protein
MAERGLSMAHTETPATVRLGGRPVMGGSTRPRSKSEASGATCIVPLIGRAGRSIAPRHLHQSQFFLPNVNQFTFASALAVIFREPNLSEMTKWEVKSTGIPGYAI